MGRSRCHLVRSKLARIHTSRGQQARKEIFYTKNNLPEERQKSLRAAIQWRKEKEAIVEANPGPKYESGVPGVTWSRGGWCARIVGNKPKLKRFTPKNNTPEERQKLLRAAIQWRKEKEAMAVL